MLPLDKVVSFLNIDGMVPIIACVFLIILFLSMIALSEHNKKKLQHPQKH
jgi:hypothetical protein